MNSIKTIMSIDGATKTTGIAIRINDNLIYWGNIKSNKKENNPMVRIGEIFDGIIKLADKYSVDYIVFEDSFFLKNIDTLKQLCRLQGCIMAYCYLKDIAFYCLLPSEWRNKLWGKFHNNREEQKRKAVDYVNENYGLNLSYNEDNEAEAICLGEAFYKIINTIY